MALFHTADYLVFCISISLSALVALYTAVKSGNVTNTNSWLLGNRNLGVLPLTISLVVSVISAVTLLGLPAEMFTYGTQYFFNIGSGLGILFTALIFVPLLYPLRLTSMFEYLEKRFESKTARLVGSVMEILALLLYGGVALYAPSTALSGVTPFPMWVICPFLAALVTFYTCLLSFSMKGGLIGVVWSDVVQAVIILVGILMVTIQGIISIGGISKVFELNQAGNRLHFYDFDPNPTTRHTFWGLSVGFGFGGLAFYGASQFTFQRFSAAKNLRQAKLTVLLNIPSFYLCHILLCFLGMIIYAYYHQMGCDPLEAYEFISGNQLLPLFVSDVLGYLPGATGLFLAAVTSAALSTVSSVMNSATSLIWDDLLPQKWKNSLKIKSIGIMRLTVLIEGLIIVALTFLISSSGKHIFQVCFAFLGASGGPQLGLFLLGAFIPRANWIGAISGCLTGLAITLWISIGSWGTPASSDLPPGPIDGCGENFTSWFLDARYHANFTMNNTDTITEVSYTWYTAVGAISCLIVGTLVSLATGGKPAKPSLILSWRNFCKGAKDPNANDASNDLHTKTTEENGSPEEETELKNGV